MPKHVLMSEIEIITDGGRRRRWTAAEKLRIVEDSRPAEWQHFYNWERPHDSLGGLAQLIGCAS